MSNKKTRPVTITTIARELGLSVSAVSYVLNVSEKRGKVSDQTARRIIETANRLGYVPNVLAQSLRKRKTGIIGVVFGTLAHSWAEMSLLGMRNVLDAEGYLPFLTVSYWDPQIEEREFYSLMQRRVEGILCIPNPASRQLYERINRQGIPLVFMNDTLLDMPAMSHIAWDAGRATDVALDHLIQAGYRRIGFLGSDHQTVMTQARYQAYIRTLRKARLPIHEEWIAWEPVSPVNPSAAASHPREVVTRMLRQVLLESKPRPEALYLTVDALAFPVLSVLAEWGLKVPEDVALISMGDLPGTELPGVELTTMHEPIEELGRQAAMAVLDLIHHPEKAPLHVTVVGNELKVRRTTGQMRIPSRKRIPKE